MSNDINNDNITDIVEKAINDDAIVPYFQPIISDSSLSFECLARIKNCSDLSPSIFVSDIKKIGEYSTFTKTMIRKSFEYFKDNDVHFCININFDDILDISISLYLEQEIIAFNIGNRLTLEIVEDRLGDFKKVSKFIFRMKALGVK